MVVPRMVPLRGRMPLTLFKVSSKGAFRPDQAVKAVGNADDLPVVFENGRLDDGSNHGIEAGRFASTSPDGYAANLGHANEVIVRKIYLTM